MSRLLAAIPAIVLSLMGAASHAALYAIDPFEEGTTLYRMEIALPRLMPIGQTGVPRLIDLAADVNGRLLAIDANVGPSRHLYQIDHQTGQATSLFDLGIRDMIAEGSIAIHQGTNAAYVLTGDRLFTLDLATGALGPQRALVFAGQALGIETNIDGLVFRGDELLGLVTIQSPLAGHLIGIDPRTLVVTDIGDTGLSFGPTAALAYDAQADAVYLAAARLPSIYNVDPRTASVTAVASIPLTQLPGLTYTAVPEPAGLLPVAGLVLLATRRRIKH